MNIIVYVEPAAKQRPRASSYKDGDKVRTRVYTPSKTVKLEMQIRNEAMKTGIKFPAGCPLRLNADFYIEKPKSIPKKVLKPVKRPDIDNMLKVVLDALNKYAYHDDAQIVRLTANKYYGSPPRIEIDITDWTD